MSQIRPPSVALLRESAEIFQASLPKSVDAACFTLSSRLPFKAAVLREALIHRVSQFSDSAVSEFEAGRWVTGSVMGRAILESAAAIYALECAVRLAVDSGNWIQLSDHLQRSLVASKNVPGVPEAINVLTQIDKLDKRFDGYRKMYDQLCEYAHPNWGGVLYAFSDADTERHVVSFGSRAREGATKASLSALLGALLIAQESYNSCASEISRLNDAFESGALSHEP